MIVVSCQFGQAGHVYHKYEVTCLIRITRSAVSYNCKIMLYMVSTTHNDEYITDDRWMICCLIVMNEIPSYCLQKENTMYIM